MSKNFLLLTTACIFFSCTAETKQNGEVKTSVGVNNKPEQVSDETETQNPTPVASQEEKLLADIQSLASKLDGTCESAKDYELVKPPGNLFSAISTEQNKFRTDVGFLLDCIDPVYKDSRQEFYRLADYTYREDSDISPETREKADEMIIEMNERFSDLNLKFSEMITITYGQGILPFEEARSYIAFTVEQNTDLNIQARFDNQVVEVQVVATAFTDAQVDRGGEIYRVGIPANNVRACADCHLRGERAPELSTLDFCSDLSITGAIIDAQFTEDENYDLLGYCKRELAPFHANNLSEQDTQAVIAFLRLINY